MNSNRDEEFGKGNNAGNVKSLALRSRAGALSGSRQRNSQRPHRIHRPRSVIPRRMQLFAQRHRGAISVPERTVYSFASPGRNKKSPEPER
jgi:hypothetical protein